MDKTSNIDSGYNHSLSIAERKSIVLTGVKKIESFDTAVIENRLNAVESSVNTLESQIKIQALTLSEYNTESHSDNILYVII